MLNFDNASSISARQTRTTQIRHDDRLASLIERAALALAVDKSVFLRAAIEREATRVLDLQSRHTLTPEDPEIFAAASMPHPLQPRALSKLPETTARAWFMPTEPPPFRSSNLTRPGTTAPISTAVSSA